MPTIQAKEAEFRVSPDGRTAAIVVRGQLDVEPTTVLLPFAMLEACVADQQLRRAHATLKQGGVSQGTPRQPVVGPDGVDPAARTDNPGTPGRRS